MAEFDQSIVEAVQAQAATNQGEIAGALQRTFELGKVEVTWGTAAAWQPEQLATLGAQPGLAILLTIGNAQAVLGLSAAGNLLPDWYAQPDPTSQSKLATLAQELGMLLLPDEFMPEDFRAERVGDLSAAMTQAQPGSESGSLAFTIQAGEKSCAALLIWPVAAGKELFTSTAHPATDTATPAITAAASAMPEANPTATQQPQPAASPTTRTIQFEHLPKYTRSLLRISVPVRVTLAEKRQPLASILELGPGAIIKFDKSCEDMLDLSVENQLVAKGEAVKVGDKFGIRITSMTLPEERFLTIRSSLSSSKSA